MSINVKNFMQSPVIVIGPSDNIAYARKVMLRERISRVIVAEGEKPIGILTKRDIIRALSDYKFRRRELSAITASEVMSAPVRSLVEGASVRDAAIAMASNNISSLAIVDEGGNLVGILTKTDMTKHFAEAYKGTYAVKDLARGLDQTPVLHRSHSVFHAMDLMDEKNIDRVVVVEGETPIGIITETDLSFVRPYRGSEPFLKGNVYEEEELVRTRIYALPTVEEVMSRDPLSVSADQDAALAAAAIVENGIGGMPVVSPTGSLAGIIVKSDFVKALAKGE
uniref:CBS domain-containing protein n=1 Tax=Candidatus Methanomethylicus mesodigestus TaxID=1867258 RepID=A0A7C3EVY8_9CREN